MQSLVPTAKHHLQKYIVSHPLGVYAVAFLHQWEDIGRVAAQACLKLPLRVLANPAPPELMHLTSTAYHNLLCYHFQCATVLKQTSVNLTWIQNPRRFCWFTCEACLIDVASYQTPLPKIRFWFANFLRNVGDLLAIMPLMNIQNHPLFADAIASAVRCSGPCCANNFRDLTLFMGEWNTKIKQEIAKVCVRIRFVCRCSLTSVHRSSGSSDSIYTILSLYLGLKVVSSPDPRTETGRHTTATLASLCRPSQYDVCPTPNPNPINHGAVGPAHMALATLPDCSITTYTVHESTL
jgi:hypothetical protein